MGTWTTRQNHSNGNHSLMTITDQDGDSCRVYRAESSLELRPHPTTVVISGEDLWNLREFINGLPDDAFVEPKPPWEPGDIIENNYDLFYVRGPEFWTVHGRGAQLEWRATDEEMDHILSRQIDSKVVRRGGRRA